MRVFLILITLLIIGSALWLYLDEIATDDLIPASSLASTPSDANTTQSQTVKPANQKLALNYAAQLPARDMVEALEPSLKTDIYSRYAALPQNENYPTIIDRLNAMNARKKGTQYNVTEVIAVLEQKAAWANTHSISESLPLSEEQKNDGREFIKFNPLKMDTLMPGDSLTIPFKQLNEKFEMVVDSVQENGNGSFTWVGRLRSPQGDNAISITQSEKNTFAKINTPSGEYDLQVLGDSGWIAPSKTNFVDDGSQTVTPIERPAEQTEQQTFPQPSDQEEQAPRQNSQEPSGYE
jgi:hypothetical protein